MFEVVFQVLVINISDLWLTARRIEDTDSSEDNQESGGHSEGDKSDVNREPEREKTEEEKANWMAEYAPFAESMYDKVKRHRGASQRNAKRKAQTKRANARKRSARQMCTLC